MKITLNIRYGLTKIDVYYNDELKYYHIEFPCGIQNIPENENLWEIGIFIDICVDTKCNKE